MKDFVNGKNKGSALMVVVILFTVLLLIVVGTLELTTSSLTQSKGMLNKIQISSSADSAMEYLLFYLSKAVAQAKKLTYNQFFDSRGNLIYRGNNFENDYINTFNSYISDFFESKGNKIVIEVKLNDNTAVQVSNVNELILYARQNLFGISNISFTKSGIYYVVKVEALDSVTKTKRIERCEFTIPSPFEKVEVVSNSSSGNSSSSSSVAWDSSIFDFTKYGLFSNDNILFSNNMTITTQNLYSNGDITLRSDSNRPSDYTIRADNIIVKNGTFTFSGNNDVKVNNLMYIKNGITFNGNNNKLECSSVLFTDGNISLNGKDEIIVNKLFCNTLNIINGNANSVTVNDFVYFSTLNIWTDKMVLKTNSRLFGGNIEIRNNGLLTAEVGTVVYANNLTIIGSSAKIDAPNTVFYCNNLEIDGEVRINAKKIICRGTLKISNLNSGANINVTDKIEYKALQGNIPSGIQNQFIQNPNISFQIPYPQIPVIVREIKKDTFPISWINLNNISENKDDINQENGYYSLISVGQVNEDDDVFKKNPNSSNHDIQLYVVSKSGITVNENKINGMLIANGSIQFNGGNLNLNFVTMPQPLVDYLVSRNIIKIENIQPPTEDSRQSIIITPRPTNLSIKVRHFVFE